VRVILRPKLIVADEQSLHGRLRGPPQMLVSMQTCSVNLALPLLIFAQTARSRAGAHASPSCDAGKSFRTSPAEQVLHSPQQPHPGTPGRRRVPELPTATATPNFRIRGKIPSQAIYLSHPVLIPAKDPVAKAVLPGAVSITPPPKTRVRTTHGHTFCSSARRPTATTTRRMPPESWEYFFNPPKKKLSKTSLPPSKWSSQDSAVLLGTCRIA